MNKHLFLFHWQTASRLALSKNCCLPPHFVRIYLLSLGDDECTGAIRNCFHHQHKNKLPIEKAARVYFSVWAWAESCLKAVLGVMEWLTYENVTLMECDKFPEPCKNGKEANMRDEEQTNLRKTRRRTKRNLQPSAKTRGEEQMKLLSHNPHHSPSHIIFHLHASRKTFVIFQFSLLKLSPSRIYTHSSS